MSLGQGTDVVNGQRNTFPTSYAWAPASWGPQTTGVPQVSPTMPPFIGAHNTAGGMGAAAGMESIGGYGTAGNNGTVTALAAANPHSLRVAPTWWAIIFLVVGLLILNGVHWRKVTLEGAEEHGHLGAVSERASEEA